MNEDSQASKQARATRDDYGFYGFAPRRPRFRQNQQQHSYGSGKIIEETYAKKHKNTHTHTYILKLEMELI